MSIGVGLRHVDNVQGNCFGTIASSHVPCKLWRVDIQKRLATQVTLSPGGRASTTDRSPRGRRWVDAGSVGVVHLAPAWREEVGIQICWKFEPGEHHAVGAGTKLVRNGQVCQRALRTHTRTHKGTQPDERRAIPAPTPPGAGQTLGTLTAPTARENEVGKKRPAGSVTERFTVLLARTGNAKAPMSSVVAGLPWAGAAG